MGHMLHEESIPTHLLSIGGINNIQYPKSVVFTYQKGKNVVSTWKRSPTYLPPSTIISLMRNSMTSWSEMISASRWAWLFWIFIHVCQNIKEGFELNMQENRIKIKQKKSKLWSYYHYQYLYHSDDFLVKNRQLSHLEIIKDAGIFNACFNFIKNCT